MTADAGATSDAPIPPLAIVALDDDADFREYLGGLLEREGHEVRTASTPGEFFRHCEDRLPDLALLDIKMGRHTGEAVLDEIRRRWARLCVIILTGYPSLETMRATFKQDVYDYLAKPFSVGDLRVALGQAAAAFGLGGSAHDRLRAGLGRQIRLSRTLAGWTLRDLSESSGVSISQLSSIERGAHLPSVESLLTIAQALDATPSEWFHGAGF